MKGRLMGGEGTVGEYKGKRGRREHGGGVEKTAGMI